MRISLCQISVLQWASYITVVMFVYLTNIFWFTTVAFQITAGRRLCLLAFSRNKTSSIFWDWFYSHLCCTKNQQCDLKSWGYSSRQDQFTCVFHTSCFLSCLIKHSIRLAPVKCFEFRHLWWPEQQCEEGKGCDRPLLPFLYQSSDNFYIRCSFLYLTGWWWKIAWMEKACNDRKQDISG